MANEYYITAGLPAIDYDDIGDVAVNAFYITAGLVANDYTPAAGTATLVMVAGAWKTATPKILIDGEWKAISATQILIGGAWKNIG